MTAIDLLPWRERRRQRQRLGFVVGVAASIAGAGVLAIAAWLRIDAEIDEVRGENRRLIEQVAEFDDRLEALADIGRRTAEVDGRIATVRQLHAERVETVAVFAALARTLAPGLRYTSLARRGRAISVRGSADAESSVSALMRNLDRSAQFGPPTLGNIADAEGGGNAALFDLTFETIGVPDLGDSPATVSETIGAH